MTRGKFSLDRKKKKKEKRKEKKNDEPPWPRSTFFYNTLHTLHSFFARRRHLGKTNTPPSPSSPPSFLLRSFFAKSLVDLSRATTRLSINHRIYSPFHAFVLLQNAKWKIVKNFTLPRYEWIRAPCFSFM